MKFKKFFAALVAVLMSFSFAACSATKVESPETVVKNYLDGLAKADFETVDKYSNSSIYNALIEAEKEDGAVPEEDSEMDKEFIKAMLGNLQYTINSSTEDGDTATVNATIKNINMSDVMSNMIGQLFALAFSGISEEEMEAKTEELLLSSINENKDNLLEKEVSINLEKTEEGWIIVMDDDFQDAITGGLFSYSENLQESFGN